jgi:hypothetical protein
MQPVLAHDFTPQPEDTSLSQVDITHGMAEQSAMHAVSNGYAPMPALQGYAASQNFSQPQQSFQGGAQGGFNNGQNYSQSQQAMNGGQNFNNGCNGQMQNQQCQQQFQQGCSQQQNYNNCGNQQGQGSGFGINKQMVGVLGAALLYNYATTGGMANVMGSMRNRGWGGRYHTLGSSVGGNVYH